ncbi:unnamed protein product [Acanthoscelides obtectus]|uniref:Uncharacterized protein n=1 Tax=Acanthoscelides obtectus TaxID=200917 RepID=A0A9P0MH21_ACAOB|nr:unnamed protein product [Acanthoscelides obtectus]CAK1650400.1 hypothetical protein AOBTE_LOCUS16761 [Acanthoscelides obtectus]
MGIWTFFTGIKETDSVKMFTIDEHVMQYSTLLTYILVGVLFVVVGFRPPWWNKKSSSSSHCYDERAAQNIPGN